MKKFLNLLEKKYPTPKKEKWATTINLSKIETTNETFNKIPDDCTVWLDIRYVPEDKTKVLSSIKKILPKDFKLNILINEPALSTDAKSEYVKSLKSKAEKVLQDKIAILSANGSSDVRHFARVGNNGVEFGPVGGGMGTDNEWVDVKSLGLYHQILKDFLLEIK
jgi:succinyl-diaminopimelate desuccinylase